MMGLITPVLLKIRLGCDCPSRALPCLGKAPPQRKRFSRASSLQLQRNCSASCRSISSCASVGVGRSVAQLYACWLQSFGSATIYLVSVSDFADPLDRTVEEPALTNRCDAHSRVPRCVWAWPGRWAARHVWRACPQKAPSQLVAAAARVAAGSRGPPPAALRIQAGSRCTG